MPSPVIAEMAMGGPLAGSEPSAISLRAVPFVEQVDLVPDFDDVLGVGRHRRRDRRRMRSTSSACAAVSGSEMSRRCRTRSASTTSSSVARKAAMRCVGRSEMKPTVSDRMTVRAMRQPHPAQRRIERGKQHVLGEHAGAGQPVEQGRLAGVGVADDRDDRERHLLALGAVQVARAAHLSPARASA